MHTSQPGPDDLQTAQAQKFYTGCKFANCVQVRCRRTDVIIADLAYANTDRR